MYVPSLIVRSAVADNDRPSRWEAQADAVNLIFSAKTQANPESSVGLMSMGGNTPEILTTLTTDIGKILDGLHRTKIKGTMHLSTGINVAAVRSEGLCGKQRTNVLTQYLVGSEASTEQVTATAHHRLHLQPH